MREEKEDELRGERRCVGKDGENGGRREKLWRGGVKSEEGAVWKKEGKMEENKGRSDHSGMKCTACVSLCCTKQSQAEHLALHRSIWKV